MQHPQPFPFEQPVEATGGTVEVMRDWTLKRVIHPIQRTGMSVQLEMWKFWRVSSRAASGRARYFEASSFILSSSSRVLQRDSAITSARNSRRFHSDGAGATARETVECAVMSLPIPDHWEPPLYLHNAPGPSITPELPGGQKGCPICTGRDPVDTDPPHHRGATAVARKAGHALPRSCLPKSPDINGVFLS